METTPTNSGLADLMLSLDPLPERPASLQATLRNNNATTTYTVLLWDTPFDRQAIALGVFKVTDQKSGSRVPTLDMKISRKLPPSEVDLIEVGPGQEYSQAVAFAKPQLELVADRSYEVCATGQWKTIWPLKKSEVTSSHLDASGGREQGLNGPFQSNSIVLRGDI